MNQHYQEFSNPVESMYGKYMIDVYGIKVNNGKYTIHGWHGNGLEKKTQKTSSRISEYKKRFEADIQQFRLPHHKSANNPT